MAARFQHRRCIWFPKPSLLSFLISVLIFISGSSAESNSKTRQCHWCGPLAEQVHRSRRAPSCEEPGLHITQCDPDSLYCATVATAPPLIISRYCVKLYQDECYPLYCNTTRTWKMTCSCRGDLCNEAISERENKAFAALTKLVTKTHSMRLKKRFVPENHDNTHNIVSNDTAPQEIKPQDMEINNTDMKTDRNKPNQEESKEESIRIVTSTVDKISKFNNEKSINENKIDDMNDLSIPAEELAEKIVTTQVEHTRTIVTVTTPKPMTTESKQSVSNVRPTDQMPPAESLQQNAGLKTNEELVTEATTTETVTTTMSTNSSIVVSTTVTTDKPMKKKNHGVTHNCNLVIFLVNCLIFFII